MAAATVFIDDTAKPIRSPLVSWLSVISVSAGIFSIVTTEILPIGLLTPIASSFHISEGIAGLTMTMPGIIAAVTAPLLTVATGRLDRRLMLCALMILLALADFLTAAAQAYWVLLFARILVGLTIGGFWSIGAGLAARLVREKSIGMATAVIFSAVPLGSVLGVPAGTLIGYLAGWRAAFVVMGMQAAGVLVALIVFVPPLPAVQVTRLNVLRGLFGRTSIRIGLLVTFLVVLAHFGTYTYVTPFLQEVTQVSPGLIGIFLLVYGAAGIVGNFIAVTTISRGLRATLIVSACMIAAATSLLPVVGRWNVGAIGLLIVWGLAYGAVPVCSQTWFSRSALHAPEAASVLFTSSFQATISIGALLGGFVVDSTSTSSVMVLGGMVAVLMVLTVWMSAGRGDDHVASESSRSVRRACRRCQPWHHAR